MGAFSSGKKAFVSTVVYNLAGPEESRVNYTKQVITSAIIFDNPNVSLGETLVQSYLKGPGIKLRHYPEWGRTSGFRDMLGMQPGALTFNVEINMAALAAAIPAGVGEDVMLQTAEIGKANYDFWVDQYLADNYPDWIGVPYFAQYSTAPGFIEVVRISDGMTVSFTPTGYDQAGRYLYATYVLVSGEDIQSEVPGTLIDLGSDPYPDTTDFATLSSSSVPTTLTLTDRIRTHSTFSDARPDEDTDDSTTSSSASFDDFHAEYEKVDYQGRDPVTGEILSHRFFMVHDETGSISTATDVDVDVVDIGGGVMQTITTTHDVDSLVVTRTTQTNTQTIIHKTWSPVHVLIYQLGTGDSTLDAFFGTSQGIDDFAPFIPLRIGSQSIASTGLLSGFYPWIKKAAKKSMNVDVDNILSKLNDNPDLGDIDYAYIVFGCPMNVEDRSGRRYIFEFFKDLVTRTGFIEVAPTGWQTDQDIAAAAATTWEAWWVAQLDPGDPLYGTAEPGRPVYPTLPGNSVQIASSGNPDINYDMTIMWSGIQLHTGTGLLKPDATPGEIWFEIIDDLTFQQLVMSGTIPSIDVGSQTGLVRLNRQITASTYEYMDIWGLVHVNQIYGVNAIYTTGVDALASGGNPGFMIPLHEGVLRGLPLSVTTQLSQSCAYIVLNCYTVVKASWYESAWFKVLLVIIVIVAIVWSGGAAFETIGLLGTNGSVGLALGASVQTAALVGAAANAVAAMVLAKVIEVVSTAAFGPKIGAIVAVIATVVAVNVSGALMSGQGIAANFSNLLNAEGLIKLSIAGANGYTGYMNAETKETLAENQELNETLNDQSKELSAKYEALYGEATRMLDTLNFVGKDPLDVPPMIIETVDSFLARTLMTGTDVAQTSLNMLSAFADITTSTKLPV